MTDITHPPYKEELESIGAKIVDNYAESGRPLSIYEAARRQYITDLAVETNIEVDLLRSTYNKLKDHDQRMKSLEDNLAALSTPKKLTWWQVVKKWFSN